MTRHTRTRPAERGSAYVIALCLFVFLVMMITAALSAQAHRRTHLRTRKAVVTAQHLAEAGAQEALHVAVSGSEESVVAREVGPDRYRAEWHRDPTDEGIVDIVSSGTARWQGEQTMRKTVRVRAAIRPSGDAVPRVQLLAWTME